MNSMELWSDYPVQARFRVKFYLDTNILAYLIDNTYPGLTQTISYLKDCNFSDLASSKYVIFEFIGIRRREHYLREVINHSITRTGQVNVSALLKYKDDFGAPEVEFNTVKHAIKQKVMQELDDITANFDINYETNILHDSLLGPTFDIILTTKISREDALMYVSSVWADSGLKDEFVFLMSNDQSFVNNCNDSDIDTALISHNLEKPHVELLRSMQINNSHKLNLTLPSDSVNLPSFLPEKLKELIIAKNKKYFLGTTIQCGNGVGFPNDVICFRLDRNIELNENLYLTIIGNNLDFIYSTKLPIEKFWNQRQIDTYPFKSENDTNISFRPLENSSGAPQPLISPIINRLRESNNLVFINPDGII